MKTIFKRSLAMFLVAVMVFGAAPLSGLVGLELPDMPEFAGFKKMATSVSVFFDSLAPKAEAATSGTCGDNLTWSLDTSTGVLTISGEGEMNDFAISERPWIEFNNSIISLAIGNNVTSIGDWAFYYCNNIKNVIIPDSVTTIGDYAFSSCRNIESITIPDSVTTIGDYAFSSCYSLENITIPDSVTTVGDYAFNWCLDLVSVSIGNNVSSIGDFAFSTCTSLKSITIPYSVTTIGDRAFEDCSKLKNVTIIGNGVASIGDYAFSSCDSLTNVAISNGVTTIGDGAFNLCTSLASITIPDSVTTIGDEAFENCNSLTNVTIGNGVTTIGDEAFHWCTSLTSVTIGNSVTTIGDGAFHWCTSLASITIPDSVTTIGDHAFSDCDSFVNITIPNSVTTIGDSAFDNCHNLVKASIGNGVISIGNSAFFACPSLESVTIGKNVTTIGDSAFASCDSLASITIPDSVTIIGDSAFIYCHNLESVSIGNGVTTIGPCAFSYCSNLECVTIPDSVTTISHQAFEYCSSLESVIIGNSVRTIGDHAFINCNSLTSVTIPDSVTTIGDGAFSACSSLTNVTIGNGVTTIGNGAFNSNSLANIYYRGTKDEWVNISGHSSYNSYVVYEPYDNISTTKTKINISNASYNCIVGEKFYISGDIESKGNAGSITLTWTSGDGVKLYTPGSIINSSADYAIFSIEAEGIKAGTYTVTVSGGDVSDSCTIKVEEIENKLDVSIEPVGDGYYLIDGKFYDSKLNEVNSLQYEVTIRNTTDYLTVFLSDNAKETLKMENVSATAGLSDYTNLLIDIADITELKNIGTLEINESKTVIVDVTPTAKKIPENVTLDVTATADDEAAVSESASISVKDKLYDPYARLSVTATPQSIDYKDKKYSTDKVDFTITVTNTVPTSFAGKASLIKQWSDYDIKVSEVKISPDDSKLLKNARIKTEKPNKTLRAGESFTFTASYNVNNWHKMDKEIKSETTGFVIDASTSSNSLSTNKSVTFVNGDYDKKIEYKQKSATELFEEMRKELNKCTVLTPAEKILIDSVISANLSAANMTDMKKSLDAADKVFEMACYLDDMKVSGYEKAGEYVIDAIIGEVDKSEDKLKDALNTVLDDLRHSEAFDKFIKWYADEQNTADSKSKKGEAKCPVDVYAYDQNGNEVLAIIDNKVVKATNGVHAFVCEDDKTFYLPTDENYTVKIVATGNGTMDYIITEYSDENELRKTVYEDIPLIVNVTYNGTVTKHTMPDEGSYNLTLSDGTEIAHDKIEFVDSNITVQADIRTPSTTTIKYGDGIVLHADLTEALPSGWKIKWTADNSNFDYTVSADGSTCTITPKKSGDTLFTVTVYDAEGNEVIKDEQTMTSKAGFFDKFVAFFKKLFGLIKIIPQAFNGTI